MLHKGKLLLAAAVSLAALFAHAQTLTWSLPTDWEASVSYDENEGRLQISGGDLIAPAEPTGAPELPYLAVEVPAPKGVTLTNTLVNVTWAPVATALRPAIVQEPRIIGADVEATPEAPQYFGAAVYPAAVQENATIMLIDGTSTLTARVTPYRWNGAQGKLEKAASLTVTFQTTDAPIVRRASFATAEDPVEFVILSPSQYTNSWEKYAEYRRGTHPDLHFLVKNTAEIYADYASVGGDDALKIHHYLEDMYASHGTKYVLLGAGCPKGSETYDNTSMIPLRMTASCNQLYYPSDMYYGCMERKNNVGEVWDPNSDGVYLGSKKSGGGYTSDGYYTIDWTPELTVFRFPARKTATLNNTTYTAAQQIEGFIEKLKRVAASDFAGNLHGGLTGYKVFAQKSHGDTSDYMTAERTFYDGMTDIFYSSHQNPAFDWEYNTREEHSSWMLAYRPECAGVYHATTTPEASTFANQNMEYFLHSSHGAPGGAVPLANVNFWTTKAIQKICIMCESCLTGKIDEEDKITIAEALLLNPNGGSVVSFNNTREGWGSANAFDSLSSKMKLGVTMGFFSAKADTSNTAGEALAYSQKRYLPTIGGGSGNIGAACYLEVIAFGDPLVKLSPMTDNLDLDETVSSAYYRYATSAKSALTVSAKSAVSKMTVADQQGGDFTVSGQEFKAFKGMTVTNANLVWSAPGGVGGSGLTFVGEKRGDLTISGTGTSYFGPRFNNVGNILVSGSNATLDLDKTGSVRDFTSLAFTGTGSNYLRTREGGVFPADFTIPVNNGTLVLQSQNIGGVAVPTSDKPLFALTNATLKICENPNWGPEYFSRPVTMNKSTITSGYQSFGFGPKIAAIPGFDLYVEAGTNTINGSYDAEVNGELRLHVAEDAVLNFTTPLVKSSYSGSILKLGKGLVSIDSDTTAYTTIAGGITVREGMLTTAGTRPELALGTGAVTVESGATLQLTGIPLESVSRLTVKSGAKLILPGEAGQSTYNLANGLKTAIDIEEGALVYNENDLNTPLSGTVTGEGLYMDVSGFLNWKGEDAIWTVDEADYHWEKVSGGDVHYTDGSSVQFIDKGDKTITISVTNTVSPAYINFANHETKYSFTSSNDAVISAPSLTTTGPTKIEPELKISGSIAASGNTELNKATSGTAAVLEGGVFHVKSSLSPATMISKVTLNVTKTYQNNTTIYIPGTSLVLGSGIDCRGWSIEEFQLLDANGNPVNLPANTQITGVSANCGSSSEGYRYNTFTVTSSENGVVTGYTGSPGNLLYVFDGKVNGNYWGYAKADSKQSIDGFKPTFSITIVFGTPIGMIGGYRLGSADNSYRQIEAWNVKVTESVSGTETQVDSQTKSGGSVNAWWPSATGKYATTYTGTAGAGSLSVATGAKLVLDGTMNVAVTLADDAVLAVTNSACMTANKGLTMGDSLLIDVSEADKFGWTKVLQGAKLSASDVYKMSLTDENAAAKVQGGDLYVATENIVKGPYTRTIGEGTNAWNTADWYANGTKMTDAWGDLVTLPTGAVTIDVTGDSTINLDTDVYVGSITITNSTTNAAKLTVYGTGTLTTTLLDFSGFDGPVTWAPALNGASVICGTNHVALTGGGTGGTLTVPAGGSVEVSGTFTTYANDADSKIRFTGTRSAAMSTFPAQGTLSFSNATLTGGYQNTDLTYLVEDGDTVVMNAASDSLYARNTGSFDIRGGSVTVNPGYGAWWFGDNGHSSFKMSGGTFTCNATGTGATGSGNGLLIGYTTDGSFQIALDITGGTLSVPNSSLNFYNPATMTISDSGKVHTKGIFSGTGTTGTLNVNEGGILEIGSIGLCTKAVDLNLNGGTIAGYENGAKLNGSVTLGGVGTLAATNGTTLAVNGSATGEGVLTFGSAAYDGTVKLTTIPEAAIWGVAGGTLHLGELRPLEKTLTNSVGAVAVTLSNAQIVDAQENPVKIIKATDVPTGGVLVYNKRGHLQNDTKAEIIEGYLTVRTTTTKQSVKGAVWSNVGNATVGGIGTAYGNGNYNNFSANFGVNDNIVIKEIEGTGTVTLTKIRFGQRDGAGNPPSSLKITQGSNVYVSTNLVTSTSKDFVLYMYNYLSDNNQKYSYISYTFTFDTNAVLDCTQDFKFTFLNASGAEINAGIRAMQPANSKQNVSGYSMCVEITGDWEYDPGELEDEEGGDSISINVVGGNSGLTGKSVSAEAGAYPIAANGWNQLASHSTGDSFSETTANLTEVRADGTVSPSAVSATLSGSCTYAAKDTTPSGANAELEYGYIDDGSTGAKFSVSGIPYSKYDVYVYMGSDQSTTSNSFGAVTVTSGSFTTNYPAASTAWGSASTTHGTVTLQEGTNYFKVCGLTGDSLVVNGAVKGTPSGTRCGLAGIQIVNTGTRYETYTWAGESDGGIWSTSAVNWTSPEGAAAAWPTVGDGNIAVFNGGRTAVSLVGNVGPSIIQINSASVIAHDDFVTGDESGEVLFANTKLSDIAGFTAAFSGGNISNKGGAATPYYYYNDGTNARVQFQINDGGYIKCVKMVCWQVGDDVMGQAKYAKYQNNVSIGIDFDSASSSTGKVVTDATTAGYGIMNVTAVMSKLSLSGTGKLTKPVTISSGTLEVVAGLLTNDVTVATGAAINVVADESADQIVITTGALEGVSFSNLYLNGATIGASTWTLDGGTLTKKYYKPSSRKLLVDLDPTSAGATNWLNFSADGLGTPIKVTNEVASLTITLSDGKMWAAATGEIAPDFSAAARVDILNAMKDDLGLSARLSDSAYDSIVRYGSDNGQSGRTASLTISGLSDDKYYNVYCAAGNTVSAKSIAATLAFTTITTDGGSTIEYITSSGTSANTWQTMASSDTATAGAANTLLLVRALRVKPTSGSIVIAANANYNPMNFVAIAELEDGKPVATDDSLVTEASDTAFNVQTCEFVGTSATNITFALPENATQVVTGTTTAEYRSFGIKVTSGTLNFSYGSNNSGNSTFHGRAVTADGSNSVIKLSVGDATGWANGGTMISLLNGGSLQMVYRDTLKTPITMQNGTFTMLSGAANGSGRALDLYAGSAGNNWTILAGTSTLTSTGTGVDRKVLIRDGAWNIDVAEDGKFILDAEVISDGVGASGTPGKLVKKGEGVLELTSASTYTTGTEIQAGTLTIGNAYALGTGAVAVNGGTLDLGTLSITNDIALTNGGTIKMSGAGQITTGTLTGATAENIYVNGVKLADSDYMLSGNSIVARALTAPLATALEGTNAFEDLTWTSANGLTVRESEKATALASYALVLTATDAATLVVSNELTVTSLAFGDNVALRLVADGTNLAAQATLDTPKKVTMINGTVTGLVADEITLPSVPAAYTIAADVATSAVGFTITEKPIQGPYAAMLASGGYIGDLVITDKYGREAMDALTTQPLNMALEADAELVITNAVTIKSLAVTGGHTLTLKFEGEGKLTTENESGLSGTLVVDATKANVGELPDYPHETTHILVVGEANTITSITLPTVEGNYEVTAAEDNKGFVITAQKVQPKNYTATLGANTTFKGITFNEGAYVNDEESTVTITVSSENFTLTVDEALTLKKMTFVSSGSEYTEVHLVAANEMTLSTLLANIAAFDFGGVYKAYVDCGLGTRISAMPSGFLYYNGTDCEITGFEITSGGIFLGGSGTLSGTFTMKSSGYFTISGSYTEAAGTKFVIENGTFSIGAKALTSDLSFSTGATLGISDPDNYKTPLETYTITSGSLTGLSLSQIKLNYESIDTTKWHFTADGKGITTKVIAPTVDGNNQGTISQNSDGEYVVTPTADYVHEIAISNAGEHTIVVPPSVTKVTGVDSAKIKVVYTVGESTFDYTDSGLFTKSGTAAEGVTIALTSDKTASVTIGDETIMLEPVLTAIDEDESETHAIAAPFVVGDETAAVGIKSIPGLMYTLVRGGDLIEVALPSEKAVDVISTRATGTRLKLEDGAKPDGKAFYIIRVGQ